MDKFVVYAAIDAAIVTRLAGSVTELFEVERSHTAFEAGSTDLLMIVDGMAGRCQALPGNRRQITALMIRGDVFGPVNGFSDRGGTQIEALSACRLARLPRDLFDAMTSARAAFAFGEAARAESATLREGCLGPGHRTARERLAYLLCELLVRCRVAGCARGEAYDLPIQRSDLAEALGLSVLHCNHVLQLLHKDGLIRWSGHRMEIRDVARLGVEGGFDACDLHAGRSADDAQPPAFASLSA